MNLFIKISIYFNSSYALQVILKMIIINNNKNIVS